MNKMVSHENGKGDKMQASQSLRQALIVTGQTTKTRHPSKRTLNHPTPGQENEAFLGLGQLDDHQLDPMALGRFLGGWQVGGVLTLQSGTPFGVLNGSDPTAALGGIAGLVGDPIRPNLNTNLSISGMTIEELRRAGGSSLFSTLRPCTRIGTTLTCAPGDRFGNLGRNVLRADGIGNVDLSVSKSTRLFAERHKLQFRVDFFNLTNTRNFGIPEARITNPGFLDEGSTDGGNRRIFLGMKYSF